MLCPHVFQETQGTSKAMKGCFASQIKIDWKRPSFPKDADSSKAAARQAAADEAGETADEADDTAKADDEATGTADEGFMSADE
jgi:predicted  nucleic acid-binding Zn-ribbon protein